MNYAYLDTPAGRLLLMGDDSLLVGAHWVVFRRAPQVQPNWELRPDKLSATIRQFQEYFAGTRTTFDIPLQFNGTEFQKSVWRELMKISYGHTSTYKDIAAIIGRPKAVRAVGTAVGSNPISIMGPCHRVLASSGGLGGYAGGLPAKQALLTIEQE